MTFLHNTHFWSYPAYVLGFIGIFTDVGCYLIKNQKRFRQVTAVNAAIWSVQYFCLGAFSSGLTLLVAMGRAHFSLKVSSHKQKINLFAISSTMFVLMTVFSWQGLISLLPAAALIGSTWAMIFKNNLKMRQDMLLTTLIWCANDIYWEAYMALIANAMAFVLNAWMIYNIKREVRAGTVSENISALEAV